MKNLYLLGFMTSGKSSLGKKIAKKLEIDFTDLDRLIEEKQNTNIQNIFTEKSEKYFREIERDTLIQLAKSKNKLIALGGGTPCFHENMELIKRSGISIYLKLPEEILIGRLRQQKENRPLVKNLNDAQIAEFVRIELKAREVFYRQADLIVEQDKESVFSIVEKINQLKKAE